MRILVISDTHRSLGKVYSVLKDINDKIDAVIHCGDVVEDVYRLKSMYPDLKFYKVKGNCDYGSSEPDEETFILCGKKFFITHGHNYSVHWSTDRLYYKALEVGADICVYGHTHIPSIENCNGIILINPGSLSQPRGGSTYSYGKIKIENGVIDPTKVEYKQR